MNINLFVENFINASEFEQERILKQIFDEDKLDCDGTLDAAHLYALINLENKSHGVDMACLCLDKFSDQNTVDNECFEAILSFKGKRGTALRISVEHAPLSFSQLWLLAHNKDGYFSLCDVLLLLYKNDCFSEKDIKLLLNKTKVKPENVKSAVEWTAEKYPCKKSDFALAVVSFNAASLFS